MPPRLFIAILNETFVVEPIKIVREILSHYGTKLLFLTFFECSPAVFEILNNSLIKIIIAERTRTCFPDHISTLRFSKDNDEWNLIRLNDALARFAHNPFDSKPFFTSRFMHHFESAPKMFIHKRRQKKKRRKKSKKKNHINK